MTQNELNFLREAVMGKCDKLFEEIVANANAKIVAKKEPKKPTETKKGENK